MKHGARPDITAILNLSCEGLLAHNSLRSAVNSRKAAEAAEISVELIVIADSPNAATVAYLESASNIDTSVHTIEAGDPGLARNAGVKKSSGRYIAFLDGGNLWCRHWLTLAFRAAEIAAEPTVWHPEASLFFGARTSPYWRIHHDIDTEKGDWVSLGLRNHWTSQSFTQREVYDQVPYRATALDQDFSHEDWCWNAETTADGCLHRHVPGSVHFIRQGAQSLLSRTGPLEALVTPHGLLKERVGLFFG